MKSIAYLGAKEKYEDVRQREIRKDFWGDLSIEELLTFYSTSLKEYWKKLRTTNIIERVTR